MRLRWKSSSHLGCSRNNGSDHSKYFPPNINLPQVSPHLTTPAGIRIQSAKLLGKPPTPIPPKISLTRLWASPRTRGASWSWGRRWRSCWRRWWGRPPTSGPRWRGSSRGSPLWSSGDAPLPRATPSSASSFNFGFKTLSFVLFSWSIMAPLFKSGELDPTLLKLKCTESFAEIQWFEKLNTIF